MAYDARNRDGQARAVPRRPWVGGLLLGILVIAFASPLQQLSSSGGGRLAWLNLAAPVALSFTFLSPCGRATWRFFTRLSLDASECAPFHPAIRQSYILLGAMMAGTLLVASLIAAWKVPVHANFAFWSKLTQAFILAFLVIPVAIAEMSTPLLPKGDEE